MSEVEFDRLLDAVRTAVAPVPHADFSNLPLVFDAPPLAANDNQLAWAFVLYPMLSRAGLDRLEAGGVTTLVHTFTGFPPTVPGSHLGIEETTRIASSSRPSPNFVPIV